MLTSLKWWKVRSLVVLSALLAGCSEPPIAEPASVIELEVIHVSQQRVEVLLAGRWASPPVVLVCPGVSLTQQRVEKALEYWEDLGYTFGPTVFMSSDCDSTWGAITFRRPTQEELQGAIRQHHLATTKRYSFTHAPTNIIGADIYFQDNAAPSKPFIVEHEIGHALGWLHASPEGHIMNAAWKKSGANPSGVSHENYKSQKLSINFGE